MSFFAQINEDLQSALKEKSAVKVATLRLLKSALLVKEKEHGKEVNDDDAITALKHLLRQHQESLEAYQQAGRQDLADEEEARIKILTVYLPAQLSKAAVFEAVRRVLSGLPEEMRSKFGLTMKEVMKELKGKADGNAIGVAVKELLEHPEDLGKTP